MESVQGAPAGLARAAASALVHATFFALGWIVATGGARGWVRPALIVSAALVAACLLSRLSAWGALAYLMVPLIVLRIGGDRVDIRRIGLTAPRSIGAVVAGLGAGAFLGVHLLLSVSLTFGYGVRVVSAGEYLAAVGYDVGANALTAEWLFRGALFSRCWRSWRFWPAAVFVTALVVVRYLLDPALPPATEIRAGAVFYMALLGLGCCGLRAWSGSLLPGYAATVTFFAAYRLLAT
ncbi:MAG TPA: CPBP family glutamic-type intramembrane protease [Methylomirabilota bacterium]|nr:CPBP family glutamic-type intramembrane protease [Methylomirabilota bacterium]